MISVESDDQLHGSSTLNDVNLFHALSKRARYEKIVSEIKCWSNPKERKLSVDCNDDDGAMKLLANESVEKKSLRRAKL